MIFKVVLKADLENGGYTVSCPALPGCHSQGDSIEEALENIKDAIRGCLKVLNDRAKASDPSEQVHEVTIYE